MCIKWLAFFGIELIFHALRPGSSFNWCWKKIPDKKKAHCGFIVPDLHAGEPHHRSANYCESWVATKKSISLKLKLKLIYHSTSIVCGWSKQEIWISFIWVLHIAEFYCILKTHISHSWSTNIYPKPRCSDSCKTLIKLCKWGEQPDLASWLLDILKLTGTKID